jgi:hypothetical protein
MTDAATRASGLMTEAFEKVERARGALFDLHQLIGGADNELDEVVAALREAGRDDLADGIRDTLLGIDVLEGRWTFQVVEEFEDGFYARWSQWAQRLRDELVDGRRHAYEAELKAHRHGPGRPAQP